MVANKIDPRRICGKHAYKKNGELYHKLYTKNLLGQNVKKWKFQLVCLVPRDKYWGCIKIELAENLLNPILYVDSTV